MNPRKLIIAFACLVVFIYGCGKDAQSTDPNACTLADPVINTVWVQQIIAGTDCPLYKGATLSSCTYKGQTCIYLENMASSQGVCTQVVYDCKGQKLLEGFFPDSDWQDFKNNMTNKSTFWTK